MEAVVVTTTIGALAQTGKYAWDAAKALRNLVKDTKNINEHVEGLATEVQALGDACMFTYEQLSSILRHSEANAPGSVERDTTHDERLWQCLKSQLDGCNKIIGKLNNAIRPVKAPSATDKTTKARYANVVKQTIRTLQLYMANNEIQEAKTQIRSHVSALQLGLIVVDIKFSHLSRKRADQSLLKRLNELESAILTGVGDAADKLETSMVRKTNSIHANEQDKQHSALRRPALPALEHISIPDDQVTLHSSVQDGFVRLQSVCEAYLHGGHSLTSEQEDRIYLLKYAQDTLSSGASLYEESIADGTVIGDPVGRIRDPSIPAWIQGIEALRFEDKSGPYSSVRTFPQSVWSIDSERPHLNNAMLDRNNTRDDSSEEDESVELTKMDLLDANLAFDESRFADAYQLFQHAIDRWPKLPSRQKATLGLHELRYKLAVCTFHLPDLDTACAALTSCTESDTTSHDDQIRQCKASLLLAQVYVKLGRLEPARASCLSARRSVTKLLGADRHEHYEAVALQARIYELQGKVVDAETIIRKIPEALRTFHRERIRYICQAHSHQQLSNSDESAQESNFVQWHTPMAVQSPTGRKLNPHSEAFMPVTAGQPTLQPGLALSPDPAFVPRYTYGSALPMKPNFGDVPIYVASQGNLPYQLFQQYDALQREEDRLRSQLAERQRAQRSQTSQPQNQRTSPAPMPISQWYPPLPWESPTKIPSQPAIDRPDPYSTNVSLQRSLSASSLTGAAQNYTLDSKWMPVLQQVQDYAGDEDLESRISFTPPSSSADLTDGKQQDKQVPNKFPLKTVRNNVSMPAKEVTAVAEAFRAFAENEKARVKEAQEKRHNHEEAMRRFKLANLKKFSSSFTLSTPIPADLLPLLSNNSGKQEVLQRQAQESKGGRTPLRVAKVDLTKTTLNGNTAEAVYVRTKKVREAMDRAHAKHPLASHPSPLPLPRQPEPTERVEASSGRQQIPTPGRTWASIVAQQPKPPTPSELPGHSTVPSRLETAAKS